MKQRIALWIAGLLTLIGLSGCLEVEQVITLKKDGSGTITEEVVMGAQIVAMLEGLPAGAGADNPFADLDNVEKYKAKAAEYGKGVTYSRMEKIERNGGKGVKVTYVFEDINNVVLTPGSAMDDFNEEEKEGQEAGAVKDDPLKFAYAGGVLTVTVPEPTEKEGESAEEEAGALGLNQDDPAMQAMMAQMLKGMKISTKLVTVAGIQKADATYVKDNTVTFMLMDFDEIMKNPNGLKTLQKLEGAKRAEVAEALKGVKGVKVETKKEIRIKLK